MLIQLAKLTIKRRGQVSAEMLLIAAALIGIAVLVITQMQSTASAASSAVANQTDKAIAQIMST